VLAANTFLTQSGQSRVNLSGSVPAVLTELDMKKVLLGELTFGSQPATFHRLTKEDMETFETIG